MSSKDKISLVLVEAKHSKEDLSFLLKKTDQQPTLERLSVISAFTLTFYSVNLGLGWALGCLSQQSPLIILLWNFGEGRG